MTDCNSVSRSKFIETVGLSAGAVLFKGFMGNQTFRRILGILGYNLQFAA
ncbi:MAG: hypothetical protein SWZ49_33190 [Cyanobacteriota bacterium]|nr:hypothetical protein [Cyanobacteriota bacterium]